MRDHIAEFDKFNAAVFGVSVDPVKSHAKFAAKHELPYPLLADEEKEVVRLYDVWGLKKFMGRTYEGTHRMSFLVDPNGKIARIYEKVKPGQHAQQVLDDLAELT